MRSIRRWVVPGKLSGGAAAAAAVENVDEDDDTARGTPLWCIDILSAHGMMSLNKLLKRGWYSILSGLNAQNGQMDDVCVLF